jgi:hypothetical protein
MMSAFKKIILSTFILLSSFHFLFSQYESEADKFKPDNNQEKSLIKNKENKTYIIGKEPGISYQVILSSEMAEALKRYEKRRPGYSYYIFNAKNFKKEIIDNYPFGKFRSPSAVFGDFNGDGIIDVVLMGSLEREEKEISSCEPIMIVSNPEYNKKKEKKKKKKDEIVMLPIYDNITVPTNEEKEEPEEKYIVKEIVISHKFENVDLYLTFHRKGEVITLDRKIMDCARETNGVITLKTDAFGIQNFDLEGRETLFNIDEYSSFGCIILK